METLNIDKLREEFNHVSESVRIVSVFSPCLQLHWEGLVNLTRERAQYTIEDVRKAFEESKTERGA